MNLDNSIICAKTGEKSRGYDRNDYFRLKVIEVKERRVSERLCKLEYDMGQIEEMIRDGRDCEPVLIYSNIFKTLKEKFKEIDSQIMILDDGTLEDEENIIKEIDLNLSNLENKVDIFSHFVEM